MTHLGYIIRYDELALKGKNRHIFERQLVRNLKRKLDFIPHSVEQCRGRLYIRIEKSDRVDRALGEVFGIASYSPFIQVDSDLNLIKEKAFLLLMDHLERRTNRKVSFRVVTKRADKRFSPSSPEINKVIAEHILNKVPSLSVDLKHADIDVGVEIRPEGSFLYVQKEEGLRGLPVGSSGRALAMLSGGIDSPVAAWCMMKRGCPIDFIHFHSYPYTGRESQDKVLELARQVGRYQNSSRVFMVPLAPIQEAIHKICHKRYRILLYRRFMHRIAVAVAEKQHVQALVTGESLGQVASQTLENLSTISQSIDMLMLRPLIAFNKQETINLAKRIGTYDISIRPHDDCCTLFQPKEPATRSRVGDVIAEEQKIPVEELIANAVESIEKTNL